MRACTLRELQLKPVDSTAPPPEPDFPHSLVLRSTKKIMIPFCEHKLRAHFPANMDLIIPLRLSVVFFPLYRLAFPTIDYCAVIISLRPISQRKSLSTLCFLQVTVTSIRGSIIPKVRSSFVQVWRFLFTTLTGIQSWLIEHSVFYDSINTKDQRKAKLAQEVTVHYRGHD